ncbi:hypothetical protein Tco_1252274 [Tanacetum coccineum]
MNTTQAQQKALNDALVAHADRLEFGKCNMRLKTDIKPKEANHEDNPDTREQSGKPVTTKEEEDGIYVALDPQE